MAKLNVFLLVAIVAVATALPQRNRPYPTTKKPEPTNPIDTPSSTAKPAPYPAAGYRPGRAFNLPTEEKKVEEPAPNYGPPADKYGPPEDSTTAQPDEDSATTVAANPAARTPNKLEPGFYFIQLPSGTIQKVSLLTNAPASALVQTSSEAVDEDDAVEQVETVEAVTPAAPAVHVQPITRRTVETWPPQPVLEVQSARLINPVRSQPIIAVEPVLFVEPKSYSYTAQYRRW